ncbi:HNH endonuclease [Fortiea contorta]|uniref:HNH endonuclease n=1 Tax=Fortiea contorta TaxID=1892405 RepID=UPI00037CE0BB|nr:HNH endonuclease signature motif containing protein [Fortiea contorta]
MDKLIIEDGTHKAWLLISNHDRQHAGNLGYVDEISKVYQYDNEVPYCRQLAESDLVLLRDKKQLIGVARIELIQIYEATKKLLRCPSCFKTKFNRRKNKKPTFHCYDCGHDFDIALEDTINCENRTANFGDTFIFTERAVSIEALKDAWLNKSKQLSMRPIDFSLIEATLLRNAPDVAKLLNQNQSFNYLKADGAYEDDRTVEYFPTGEDRRETVFRQIKERRGQSKFRNLLRQCYGDQCMISRLKLLDVLEAAHISPYRGTDDNHPDNGLLLRADLHTLFDLNLLGINPESLEVKFHPKILETGYQKLEGRKLRCSKHKPSQSALVSRWKQFLNRLNENS